MSLTGLLSMTKAQFKSTHPLYDHIAVGSIIFTPSSAGPHRLLLLKRAAHDPAFPNMFAIPGGHVEDTDTSLLHGLKREVREETTMVARGVIDQIEPLVWVSGASSASVQVVFVCEVEGETVRVDPEEHSVGVFPYS